MVLQLQRVEYHYNFRNDTFNFLLFLQIIEKARDFMSSCDIRFVLKISHFACSSHSWGNFFLFLIKHKWGNCISSNFLMIQRKVITELNSIIWSIFSYDKSEHYLESWVLAYLFKKIMKNNCRQVTFWELYLWRRNEAAERQNGLYNVSSTFPHDSSAKFNLFKGL